MKYNKYILLMGLSCMADVSFAGTKMGWATTPFWTGPITTEIDVELVSVFPKDLKEQCKDFRIKLVDEGKYLTYQDFDRWRKYNPDLNSDLPFKAYFKINNNKILNNLTINDSGDNLPFYIQNQTEQVFNLASIDLQKESRKVSASSLTQFGAKLDSANSISTTFSLTNYKYQQAIQVDGKDLACDLLEKKAGFLTSVSSNVDLTVESKNKIQEFYLDKVTPEINSVLNTNFNQALKAALIGFRVGKVLESEQGNLEDKSHENTLKKLFTNLFNEKLERTNNWIPDSYQAPTKFLINAAQGADNNRVIVNLNGRIEE
jgi:hypothetical protein